MQNQNTFQWDLIISSKHKLQCFHLVIKGSALENLDLALRQILGFTQINAIHPLRTSHGHWMSQEITQNSILSDFK